MKKIVSIFKIIIQLNLVFFKPLLRIFITLLFSTFCCFQVASADTEELIKSAKKDSVNVYSGPSSSKKIKGFTIESDELKGKIIEDSAMNGRFLKIKFNGKGQWIKAKQVYTTQVYDVGACEKPNKTTGTRAAVNCTE
jgi:hypothetical protein